MVRQGFYYAVHKNKAPSRQELDQTTIERVLLTNTVPYKPPGNKAYLMKVKNRFRPFIEQLFVFHWQGDQIITLGTEAFKWFAPYGASGEVESFYRRDDRFDKQLKVNFQAINSEGRSQTKTVTLLPLPHPSPLNQKYYAAFPKMLQTRLLEVDF